MMTSFKCTRSEGRGRVRTAMEWIAQLHSCRISLKLLIKVELDMISTGGVGNAVVLSYDKTGKSVVSVCVGRFETSVGMRILSA